MSMLLLRSHILKNYRQIKSGKSWKEILRLHGNAKFFSHSRENCLFDCGVSCQFDKSASAFNIYEQVILHFFDRTICSTKESVFAAKWEGSSHQRCGNESFHWCQLNHGCKPIAKHTNVLGLGSFCR